MNALIIGDCHLPYEHPDAIEFVKCLRDTYRPKITIQIGDLFDLHQQSWHDKNPECLGARAEFDLAREKAKTWEPLIDVVTEGNHCLRPERVAKKFGLLPEMLADKRSMWNLKVDFVRQHTLHLDDGSHVVCQHGDGGFPRFGSTARKLAHHSVTGHWHTMGGVNHYTLMDGTHYWTAATGCLIDATQPAFSYSVHPPVLGSIVIHDDTPVFEQMKTDKHNRWTGQL